MRILIYSVSEHYAARLEAQQAEREFSEALDVFRTSGARVGSPQDYAVWNAGAYADSAQRVARGV